MGDQPHQPMTIFLEPYHPNWKTEFEHLNKVLAEKLRELIHIADIQHIGSASIPGLIARPILDIDILIANKKPLTDIKARLEKIGYQSKVEQGIPGRFAVRQMSATVPFTGSKRNGQAHHLYVCYADSIALKNHIFFRDTLRNDKDLLEQYAALKKSLANNSTIPREDYVTMKTDSILSVLAAAGLNETELPT